MRTKKPSGAQAPGAEQERLVAIRLEALEAVRQNDFDGLKNIVERWPEVCAREARPQGLDWPAPEGSGRPRDAGRGHDLLGAAIRQRRAKMTDLLAPLSNARAASSFGETPLMMALDLDDAAALKMIKTLLPLSDPDMQSDRGMTALMLAAEAGDAKAVELLLPVTDARKAGAGGRTALHFAVAGGCWTGKCVEMLLPKSDVEAKDEEGLTALEIAGRDGHEANARAILAFMASEERKILAASTGHGQSLPGGPLRL